MAALKISQVVKAFGAARVLHDIDIDISDGEFVVLVGPSGCGKSTLLRMIAGLEDLSEGDIYIGDRNVSQLHPKDRDIAMVFQSYALYPHMTVAENMGFSLRMRGGDKKEIAQKVSSAAAILDLEPLLERFPRQLSGGQRQRVAMGRAIVRDPEVFLFDEPLSNLDAKLRVQMRAEIRSLHRKLGATIVYVTHDQIEAMTMADKIVVMRAGRVEQIGDPLSIYDRPENTFVAGFLGAPAMNLLRGRFSEDASRFELDGGGAIRVSAPVSSHAGRPLVLGVRPDSIALSQGEGAEVTLIEPTGAELHVNLAVGEQSATALIRERAKLSLGEKVGLTAASDALHFFDAETERRIA